MRDITGGVCAPEGFMANGIHAGMRKNKSKKDLSLIYSKEPCIAAATYTQNKVKGAPLIVTKKHLKDGIAQAIICNSGNANTCNSNGVELATETSELLAKELGIKEEDVIVASTGVIGQPMVIDPFKEHMHELVAGLKKDGSDDAVQGIMTTDTKPKEYAVEFVIDGQIAHIGAIAKGSGMIHPNMATMLAFVTSDVDISKEMLDIMIHEVVNDTFNMVSVDGDTSTNDMLCVMCNGLAGNKKIVFKDHDYQVMEDALFYICAKAVAKSVITSSLFKAAMFGKDANWGRILCAIGYAPADVDVNKVDVHLQSTVGNLYVCHNGMGVEFDEEFATKVLSEDEIIIAIDLNDGDYSATAWGCDLTYDYVKINGDYRT